MNKRCLTGLLVLLCMAMAVTNARACNLTPVAQICDSNTPYTQWVCVGDTVALDGSMSYDTDGTVVLWEWDVWYYDEQEEEWVKVERPTGERTSFEPNDPGKYCIELWVKDDDKDYCKTTDTDWCTVYAVEVAEVVKFSSGESGPLYTCLDGEVVLEAKSNVSGPFPDANLPTWQIIDTDPDGLTATLEPYGIGGGLYKATISDFSALGDYIVEAKCGNNDPGDNTITLTVVEPELEILDEFDKPGADQTILFADGSSTTGVSAILTPVMSGTQVDFTKESGSGTVTPSSADTDAQGKAVTTLTAAASTGKTVVKATVHDAPSASDSAIVYMSEDFDFNTIISNTELTVTPASLDTQAEIQNWLQSKDSGLAEIEYGGDLISQIIHDSSATYNINVQVILVTLQKENGLISDQNPSQSKLDHAMGYGSPSNIRDQIQDGTACFRNHYNNAPAMPYIYPIGSTASQSINYYDSTDGLQQVRVKINNAATYSLYKYTNYVRSQASGGGNYLFRVLWDQYGF